MLPPPTGEDGLGLAFENLPDIIVVDISLPDIDGVSVLEQLQENDKTPALPVIAISAAAMKRDVIKGIRPDSSAI